MNSQAYANRGSLRIACLLDFAPSKLGSLEAWLSAMAREAVERGHVVDFYTQEPIHPRLRSELERLGTKWDAVDDVLESFWRARRVLASYDVIHLSLFAPRSRAAILAYAAWPAKVLFVDHYSGTGAASRQPRLKRAVDSHTMHRAAGLVGVSEYVTRRDIDRFRFPPERARTIYNGVPVERFVAQPPDPNLPPTLLAVSSLIPEKGISTLLRALARMRSPDARLWIAGEGPEGARLAAQAQELGIEARTSFLGLRDDVPQLLQNSHVFVHPALWQEAFGLVIAEAMAAARPVVASAVGGIPELVKDGHTGVLVPPGDVKGLARALDTLVSDADLRRRLGSAGRIEAEARFRLGSCVQAHLSWCEEIAGD